jgi:SulP family sulfate permease
MANGLLAAVNPIHGVYAYMVGVFTGALFTSSVYMSVQGTSAMALIVADVPEVRASLGHLVALSILTGVIMAILGVLKLGSLLRFVPNSVMTGFINGIALKIILSQLDDLTGYASQGANRVTQTLDLLFNLNQIHPPTLFVGIATIILILVLEKTALKSFGLVVALLLASLLPLVWGWDSVALVRDIAVIPDQLPLPMLPPLSAIPVMILPAIALALVGLIQGAGVSQNYVNPDGEYPDASQDFVGQGAANIASGLFQGLPVGGSVSATALVVSSGAKTRLANITAGITMAVSLLLFVDVIKLLAMPALAGLLIIVGFRTLKLADIRMVAGVGPVQQGAMIVTLVATLLIPLQFAVLLGVAIAVLLTLVDTSNKVRLKELIWEPGELPLERDVPDLLPPDKVTILVSYGGMYFASASKFEEQLPELDDETRNAVVILNLRGYTDLGSTFLLVMKRYAEKLHEHNCRFMMAGVGERLMEELENSGLIRVFGRSNVFRATERRQESTLEAYDLAQEWIQGQIETQAEDQAAEQVEDEAADNTA